MIAHADGLALSATLAGPSCTSGCNTSGRFALHATGSQHRARQNAGIAIYGRGRGFKVYRRHTPAAKIAVSVTELRALEALIRTREEA